MKIEAVVINLARRKDRRARAEQSLKAMRLSHRFIEAVDARQGGEKLFSPLGILRDTEIACNASHALACSRFLEGASDFALVLEDDFELSARLPGIEINFSELLEFLAQEMRSRGLNVLQLGYIRAAHPWWNLDRITACVRKWLWGYWSITWRGRSMKIVRGDFLSGAHAYLVDRVAALELSRRVLDTTAMDDYLRVQSNLYPYRYARLEPGLFRQQSRDTARTKLIDSDISS